MPVAEQDIFNIEKLEHNAGVIIADVLINPASDIFKGHFPGQPVVPGASILQLLKDVIETALHAPVHLKKAGTIKFISMLTPQHNSSFNLEVGYKAAESSNILVSAKITSNELVCFKFTGEFIKI